MKIKTDLESPTFGITSKLFRFLWDFCYILFFRFSPVSFFFWRTFILRMFGAKIGKGCRVYPSAKIWLPRNLVIGDKVALGPRTFIYNQGKITIGNRVIISQGSHLCASTHDYNNPIHPLVLAPITIDDDAWVCADAFVGPWVNIGTGAVLGARGVATKILEPWCIYAGNPIKKLKKRNEFNNAI